MFHIPVTDRLNKRRTCVQKTIGRSGILFCHFLLILVALHDFTSISLDEDREVMHGKAICSVALRMKHALSRCPAASKRHATVWRQRLRASNKPRAAPANRACLHLPHRGAAGMSTTDLVLPAAVTVVVLACAVAVLFTYTRVRKRKAKEAHARELERYENQLQVERSQRALQRAREVLAERTGNAAWNPQLEEKVRKMQLDNMPDTPRTGESGVFDDPEDGMFGEPMAEEGEVVVCDAAIRLVAEYGAQGAMMQVMQAAKKQLDKELKELEASDKAAEGGIMEENIEDPNWRERVQDQVRLKELERQLAAVDEETEDMLSEEERQRKRQLEALDQEGMVTIETFPGTGHGITVRARARPPPRPVAWARMSQTLHRPLASEELVQRSVEEGRAVQGYSSALRAMAAEVESNDQAPSSNKQETAAQLTLEDGPDPNAAPEPYTGTVGRAPPMPIKVGKKLLNTDHQIIVGGAAADREEHDYEP